MRARPARRANNHNGRKRMAQYVVDGVVLDTEEAEQRWEERKYYNGRCRVSVNTGLAVRHETLYRHHRGWYWVHDWWSEWGRPDDTARILEDEEAAAWLLLNEHELPPDLAKYEDEILE
jgi:hypothetical protein